MRRVRFSTPAALLMLAVATQVVAASARADDAPTADVADAPPASSNVEAAPTVSPAQTAPSSSSAPAAAPAGTVEDSAAKPEEKKTEEKKEEQPVNARLAPGGVLGGGGNAFPLRLTATIDNFVGSGFLQQSPGASVIPVQGKGSVVVPAPNVSGEPQFGSSLSLRPSAMLPKLDGLPRMLLSASLDFSVGNWLPTFTNFGVYERQVRVSDFGVGVILPGALREPTTGIVATPIASVRAPLSITSRMQNLITSGAVAVQMSWTSPETPVGLFAVQYTPSIRGNVYAREAATIPCEAGVNLAGVVANPLENGDTPVAYARTAEVTADGECVLRGRQAMGNVANNSALAWIIGDHTVALTLGHVLAFVRPLASRPDLTSQYASDQAFIETSNGSISYTYTVPVETQMFLTAGISSSQPAFTASNQLRFPFFDFYTPANNFAAAFFDISVGI